VEALSEVLQGDTRPLEKEAGGFGMPTLAAHTFAPLRVQVRQPLGDVWASEPYRRTRVSGLGKPVQSIYGFHAVGAQPVVRSPRGLDPRGRVTLLGRSAAARGPPTVLSSTKTQLGSICVE
jgi:hypothetical protein